MPPNLKPFAFIKMDFLPEENKSEDLIGHCFTADLPKDFSIFYQSLPQRVGEGKVMTLLLAQKIMPNGIISKENLVQIGAIKSKLKEIIGLDAIGLRKIYNEAILVEYFQDAILTPSKSSRPLTEEVLRRHDASQTPARLNVDAWRQNIEPIQEEDEAAEGSNPNNPAREARDSISPTSSEKLNNNHLREVDV